MNETEFSQILEQVCMEEYTLPEKEPVHHFSLKHRRRMKRILALPRSAPEPTRRLRLNRRTVCILIAIIFLAAGAAAGAAAAYVISPFIMKEHSDNTELFAGDISGAPEIIERVYYLDGLPEGYEEIERYSDWCEELVIYQFGDDSYNIIMFTQTLKSEFNQHFNTEGHYFEEIKINGHDGLYIDFSVKDSIGGSVVWDSGDYIFVLDGDLTKNELINLAKSAKLFEP